MERTLIEQIADQRRLRLDWDPTVKGMKRPPRRLDKRDQYRTIPCRTGDIYHSGSGVLSWHCMSRRIGQSALKKLGDWFTVQVEAEGEWIFNFPAGRFDEVARIAKPRRKRRGTPHPKLVSEVGV